MRRLLSFALAGSLLAASVVAEGQARDVRVSSAPSGTASIAGVVVSADANGKPIRQANLVIIGATTGVLRVAATDPDGRFSFAGLPADRYVIGASKPPYLGAVAGARRPARPGTPVVVSAGQKIADVIIRMPLGAAIAGVITDERGLPAAGVQVALRERRLQGAEFAFTSVPGGNATTDERGRYRMYGLPPGEYQLVAMSLGRSVARVLADADVDAALKGVHVAVPAAVDPGVAYAPVYFPGTTRESDAAPITLAAGEERAALDFRLELTRNASVEGSIFSADGQPVANATVLALPASASNPVQGVTMAAMGRPDGRFLLGNLRPGSYTLLARLGAPQGGRSASTVNQFATVPVDVAGTDVTGVQMTLRPVLTIQARLAFDGTAPPPPLAGRRIPLQTLTPGMSGMAAPLVTPATSAGAFTVTNIMPGRYLIGGPLFLGATSDSVTWALQSVVADGRDVTDLPIDITADAVPKEIVVTYGDRWQELSGRLSQPSGAAASEYTVVVFPADKAYWIPGSRRILTAHPGSDGRFTFGGPGPNTLPPGAYLLAAVTELDRDEQFDPALLASLVAAGVPVALQPGERKTQDLTIR